MNLHITVVGFRVALACSLSLLSDAYHVVKECPNGAATQEGSCMKYCIFNQWIKKFDGERDHVRRLALVFRMYEVKYDQDLETMTWAIDDLGNRNRLKNTAVDNVTITAYYWKVNIETEESDEVGRPVATCCGVPVSQGKCRVLFDQPGELFYSMQLYNVRFGIHSYVFRKDYQRYKVLCPEIKQDDWKIMCILVDTITGNTTLKPMRVELQTLAGETDNRQADAARICSFTLSNDLVTEVKPHPLDSAFGIAVLDVTKHFNVKSALTNCTRQVLRLGDNSTYPLGNENSVGCFRYDWEQTEKNSTVYCLKKTRMTPGTPADKGTNVSAVALTVAAICVIATLVVLIWLRRKGALCLKKRRWNNNHQLDAEQNTNMLSEELRRKQGFSSENDARPTHEQTERNQTNVKFERL